MARAQIETREQMAVTIIVGARLTQATDGRLVAEDHPDAIRVVAPEGSTFTLAAALAAGIVEMVDGQIVGAEIEVAPLPEGEE